MSRGRKGGADALGGGRRRAGASSGARAGRGPAAPKRSSFEVPATELRWVCGPLKPSGKPPTAAFLLGQDRPMAALRTGLSIHAPGYNIFLSGLIGSGRTAVVELLLRDIQPICRRVPDRVFVHNFREPNRPLLVSLPAGRGPAFRDELVDLGRALRAALLAAIGSRPHRASRRIVKRASAGRERRIMDALSRQAQKQGCALVRFQAQNGATTADIYPVVDGEPVQPDALQGHVQEGKLDAPAAQVLLAARERLVERLDEVSERMRAEFARLEGELRAMDRQLAWKVLRTHTKEFQRRWPQPEVADWLDAAGEFLERHVHVLVGGVGDAEEEAAAVQADVSFGGPRLIEFESQVVKTSFNAACPVVIETNPNWGNLFGTISTPTDGTPPGPRHVQAGAMLRAEGGYLVLRCLDLLREPGVWPQFKRALQTGRLEIREFDHGTGAQTGALQPEAIPLDLKVVLIGEPGVYEALAAEDVQFAQVFKVHAEFDSTIPLTKPNLVRYADYLNWLSAAEGLLPIAADGMAAVAEYGARAAGRRDRLITRYSELGDIAREACHAATAEGAGTVTRAFVEAAVRARRQRHDLAQELTERDYASGYMHLSTSGEAIGQINALTVLDTGSIAFGRPCRITCNSGVATAQRSGLINIEGLANLSGPIHDKGVMILEGYLLQEFGRDGPLCMQATICFEQLYHGVEGDSASLAQLLALLSSLAGVPLRQGLAITGSVNQKGEVQAVGGINDKVEGFFRLCRARRLTGGQGVVVPVANVNDLMLAADVVEAVERGEFVVHAVASVRDAIEAFTGEASAEVLRAVRETLRQFRATSVRSG
jgi:predicted ATP-dependent protease